MTRLLAAMAPLLLASGAALAQDHGSHAGHTRPAVQTPPADPHAAHAPPSAPVRPDPHAGHAMPASTDPHAGHRMGGAAQDARTGPPEVPTSADDPGRPRPPPPPPAALSGPAHAADAIWGAERMAASRQMLLLENGGMGATAVIIDRLELGFGDGEESWTWDLAGWTGGDINRFWWKSEGEGDFDGEAEGELQALYSRAVTPFWDVQAGIRQDVREDGEDPTHLVLGLQGLAPYWWEVDAAAFVSTAGDLTARVEAEYDQRLTQRLILQPRIEVEASAADVPELGLGSGLTHVEAGLRLRYEIAREFAPYAGVEWSRELGGTADLTRALGGDPEHTRLVVGLKAWF
jgi:copper resistance protein B